MPEPRLKPKCMMNIRGVNFKEMLKASVELQDSKQHSRGDRGLKYYLQYRHAIWQVVGDLGEVMRIGDLVYMCYWDNSYCPKFTVVYGNHKTEYWIQFSQLYPLSFTTPEQTREYGRVFNPRARVDLLDMAFRRELDLDEEELDEENEDEGI